jgi:hypothetical protein
MMFVFASCVPHMHVKYCTFMCSASKYPFHFGRVLDISCNPKPKSILKNQSRGVILIYIIYCLGELRVRHAHDPGT